MRGIYTPVIDVRRKVFTEVARLRRGHHGLDGRSSGSRG